MALEKCLLPPVPSLCYMMRDSRRYCSCHSCHVNNESNSMPFINNSVRCSYAVRNICKKKGLSIPC
jgi:hypothetical protein